MVLSDNLSFYETTKYSLKEVRRVKSISYDDQWMKPYLMGFQLLSNFPIVKKIELYLLDWEI